MASELLRELLQATVATSAAIVLLQLLRRPLRQRLGARLAYQAWLLVPVAMLAVWIPAQPAPAAPVSGNVLVQLGTAAWTQRVEAAVPFEWNGAIAIAWLLGGAGALLWFALRQHTFTRQLSRRNGRAFDTVAGLGPAVVGWWRSRIVLPEDFRERYTRGERRLVLAHEIAHLRGGDIHAQALVTALRCLFWFNPLVHIAAAAFRFDQELACDAAVLGRFPRARGRYGSAMLKTQLAGFGLPVGCHWQSSHPLKERIEMLKQPLPARTRKIAGSMLVAAIVGCGTWAAWAAQPAAAAKPATAAKPAALAQPAAAAKSAAAPAPVAWLQHIDEGDVLTPPVYPKSLKKVHGNVTLELLVGEDGNIKDVKVVKSNPAGVFDRIAMDTARTWHITPARAANGAPFERRVRTQVEFRPDGAPQAE